MPVSGDPLVQVFFELGLEQAQGFVIAPDLGEVIGHVPKHRVGRHAAAVLDVRLV